MFSILKAYRMLSGLEKEFSMVKYEIIPLVVGELEADKSDMMYFKDRGINIKMPVVSFYIKGGKQNILVDTGAPVDILEKYHPGKPVREVQSFETALGSQGLTPDDIDIVIQTHLHFDHCGYTARCRSAKVIVQEDELKFALAPHPVCALPYSAELLQGLRLQTVAGDVDITEGIRVLLTPGHTPGGQSVAIETPKGTAIITGFCSIDETFNVSAEIRALNPGLLVYAPGFHTDAILAFESALRVKGLADILVPSHSLELKATKTIP
jgi:glyoxylase-like metal-dependent hydrolase (beta-lactamase superfamily II)